MVKIFTFKKIDWVKNNDDKGGALHEVMAHTKDNEVVIHSQTKKNGRMWASVTPEKLCNLVEKNHGIYEVITSYPHKVYFDIDKKNDVAAADVYLRKLKQIIETIFPSPVYAISGSVCEAKTSFHIVLENYVVCNQAQQQVLKNIVRGFYDEEEGFDWKVYTKNRNMKCVNQSKLDGRLQAVIENENLKSHLITCFLCDCYNTIPHVKILPEKMQDNLLLERAHSTFDLAVLPKLTLKTPDELKDKVFDQNTNSIEILPPFILFYMILYGLLLLLPLFSLLSLLSLF